MKVEYVHSVAMFHALSFSFVWIETEGERKPALEIHINGGSGPDLVKRLLLTEKRPLPGDGYEINEVVEFAAQFLDAASQMRLEMNDPEEGT